MGPSREGVFKYLDGLKKRNAPPDEYLNRVTGRFLVSSEVAQSYIADWVGKEYEERRYKILVEYSKRRQEIEQNYQDDLIELNERVHEELAKLLAGNTIV